MRLVAYQPDIAANLGAMMRICACFDIPLDVIEHCGFPFSTKAAKRAAMDYADMADMTRHASFAAWMRDRPPGRLILLTTKGATSLHRFAFRRDDAVMLGRESAGAPPEVHRAAESRLFIPMPGGGRSLNVAVSAGIVLAEALRQFS